MYKRYLAPKIPRFAVISPRMTPQTSDPYAFDITNHQPRPLYNILKQISSKNGKGVIIICECCKSYICPPPCPNFNGYVSELGYPKGSCEICASRVYDDGTGYEYDGKMVCADCAEELISRELLNFLGCTDIKDFFSMLP